MRRIFINIIRDLLKDKFRTTISLLAIIFGATAFGTTLFAYNLTQKELNDGYLKINPSSANILVDKIDDNLIGLTKGFKEIGEFEEKGYYELRIKVGEDEWKTLHLFAIKDFDNQKVNQVTSERGKFSTGKNEILIERDALGVAATGLDQTVSISMPDSKVIDFKIVGIVHDITTHPASVENIIPVYISYDRLADLGLTGNRLDFILSGSNKYKRANIMAAGNDYIKLLESNGYKVKNFDVLADPGHTIHQMEYDAVLFILGIASILAYSLGCLIMSSLISTMLSSQIKQIGILKAIGAKTKDLFISYMLAILAYVAITIVVSVPCSIILGRSSAKLFLNLGNMDLNYTMIPAISLAFFIVLGLVVPLVVAVFPIRRGVKYTVKEAISNYGTVSANTNEGMLSNLGEGFKLFSRPVLLSIRNAARRKGRFYLNIISLTLGGALFIASIMAVSSMRYTISKDLETFNHDYRIETSNSVDDAKLKLAMKDLPEIKEYENWGSSTGKILYEDGTVGNLYTIMAPQPDTKTFEPVIMQGRWLSNSDTNEIVVGHQIYTQEPSVKFGDAITLMIGDTEQQFKIVGTVKELGSPTIFLNKKSFEKLIPAENKKNSIKLMLADSNAEDIKNVFQKTENKLKENGVIIFQADSIADLLMVLESHGLLVVVFFVVIAVMILIVAGFGLTSTMSVQVAERTKEIGIMKAMGASSKQIKRIVTAESIFLCILSWVFSIFIGIPIGAFVAYAIGNIMVSVSLDVDYVQTYIPIFTWLVLTFVLGYFASRTAARKAARMTVKETLSFE